MESQDEHFLDGRVKSYAFGTPGGTRTPDLLLRRQLLYPAELLAYMERVMGIEPTPTAWKAVVLAVILHPQLPDTISPKILSQVPVIVKVFSLYFRVFSCGAGDSGTFWAVVRADAGIGPYPCASSPCGGGTIVPAARGMIVPHDWTFPTGSCFPFRTASRRVSPS